MMPAVRKSYRIPEPTQAKIAALAERWGGISPETETAVIVEAVHRAHAAEFGAAKKPKPAKP